MGGQRRVSRLDRYLLSQLLGLFGFFSLVLVAVYWINRAVGLFDQLIGDGQSALCPQSGQCNQAVEGHGPAGSFFFA